MPAGAWRTTQADALEAQAAAIAAALEELENVHALLELRGRDALCTELRGLAAGLRSEASAIAGEARALRAPEPEPAMPVALTTRHVRGATR